MIKDPRYIALNVLLFWHKATHTLDTALERHSSEIESLSLKDKKLCNALIFGVLRKRESIDWIIDEFSNISLDRVSINLLYILRIALFQIVYMDRIPLFAAINTSVEIAKKEAGSRKAGFINAVLRKASAEYRNLALPDSKKYPEKFIAVKYSLPLWLSIKWSRTYGFEKTEKLCRQLDTIPPITIRTNTLKTDRAVLLEALSSKVADIEKTKFTDEGLSFNSPVTAIHELKEFKRGFFQVQDEAAQIITHFLAPRPGEKILDACAGFGGKTGHIAQIMDNQGIVIAADTGGRKLESLAADMKKLNINIVKTRAINIIKSSIKDFDFYFDRVLVDAPCTGLGVLRRNPDTKWKRSRNDMKRLGSKQKKILNASASLVKPGGILVYAVCSCETEENENVIQHFLDRRKDFSIDTEFEPSGYDQLITQKGFLKTYPEINNMDGFFAARLIRNVREKM